MLKNSTGRFRLRDWVFIGGGSIAAAVATTIIFWPLPKSEVAVRTQPRASVSESTMLEELDTDMQTSGAPGDVTLHNGQDRWAAKRLSKATEKAAQPFGSRNPRQLPLDQPLPPRIIAPPWRIGLRYPRSGLRVQRVEPDQPIGEQAIPGP